MWDEYFISKLNSRVVEILKTSPEFHLWDIHGSNLSTMKKNIKACSERDPMKFLLSLFEGGRGERYDLMEYLDILVHWVKVISFTDEQVYWINYYGELYWSDWHELEEKQASVAERILTAAGVVTYSIKTEGDVIYV